MTWAITGLGLVSSLGGDTATALGAFAAGATSVHPLRSFDQDRYRVACAYEIDDRAGGADRPGRATEWLVAAITQALTQSGLEPDPQRTPVLVGTGLAEQRSVELWRTGSAKVSLDELHFAGAVRRATGLPHTLTIVNACSASLFALAAGTDLLALGEADAVVVAGTDALSESMFGLLDRVNARPPSEVRPFDADRQGVILGEGAAALVLEPLDKALARGADPIATVLGVGTTCDAHHVTAPLREGIGRAFADAQRRAGISPDSVDLVLAHGTGTLLNDETEAQALNDAFPGRKPMLTALKSLIGHTSGASGLMSLVTAAGALTTGDVPPTRNHVRPIEPLREFAVVTEPRRDPQLRTAQVNAFGFGGVNAVALLGKFANWSSGKAAGGAVYEVGKQADENAARGQLDVVITGAGIEIPGISDLAELLALAEAGQRLRSGRFTPADTLGQRGLRYKDRATLLALCAAVHALDAAGLPHQRSAEEAAGFGVMCSTELALAESVDRVVRTIHGHNVMQTSPMDLPNVSGNVAAAQLAIWFQLGATNLTLSAGATSGVDAVYHAATAIRAGRAARMLVVGVEPADPVATELLHETAHRRGEAGPDGVTQVRPFDGAAALILETAGAARARGATVLARIGSYARSTAAPQAGGGGWSACAEHPGRQAARTGPSLSSVVGEASAALGVLQCAAAAVTLSAAETRAGTPSAAVTAGGCWGSAYATITLEAAR